jgi:AraC-like DNA-binding protein
MDTNVIIFIFIAIIIVGAIIYFVSSKKKSNNNIVLNEKETSILPDTQKNEEIKNNVEIIKSEQEKVINIEKPTITQPKIDENLLNEETLSNTNIASKTEKALLKKLELFEKNKGFIKKDVNLTSLAKQFETNTKYLSEIIKTYRQKQFNNYLNELRINYIVDRLQNEPKYINTKISYLASDCGFTSHSTFTTIFTQIMNESPSVFMKRIKEEKKNI